MENMKYCIYYNEQSGEILDLLPMNLAADIKSKIFSYWSQGIAREILVLLSMHEKMTAPKIKEEIGHSMSTLHEIIGRLEDDGLIITKMIYSQKRQKTIVSNVLCVTKNPKHKILFGKFFKGIWVDSKNTEKVIAFLKKNPDKYFTVEEISTKINRPVDEVELLLTNWDSITTRALSTFLKPVPFEKKTAYRYRG